MSCVHLIYLLVLLSASTRKEHLLATRFAVYVLLGSRLCRVTHETADFLPPQKQTHTSGMSCVHSIYTSETQQEQSDC